MEFLQGYISGDWWQFARHGKQYCLSMAAASLFTKSQKESCRKCGAGVIGWGARCQGMAKPERGKRSGTVRFCLCRRCFLSIRAFAKKQLNSVARRNTVARRVDGYIYTKPDHNGYERALQAVKTARSSTQATIVDLKGTAPTPCYIRCGRSCMGEHRYLRGWYEQMVGQDFDVDEEYGPVSWQYCLVSTRRLPQSSDAEGRRVDVAVRRISFEHKAVSVRSISFVVKSQEQMESFS